MGLLHQLDLESLASIVRSFAAVYPRAWALLATNSLDTPVIGLLARADDGRFDMSEVRGRLARQSFEDGVAAYGIVDEWALLGSLVAGPDALARLAAGAALNTDDRPIVAYRAPRTAYVPDSTPRERLIALLQRMAIAPNDLIEPHPRLDDFSIRLAAYWRARDSFIEAGRDVQASTDVRRSSKGRAPLVAVLRISPDFRPAYDPLLRMAGVLAPTDPRLARELLSELMRLQPARGEAAEALRQLPTGATER